MCHQCTALCEYCTFNIEHCTLHIVHCTLHITHYTIHTAQCALHTIQITTCDTSSSSCNLQVNPMLCTHSAVSTYSTVSSTKQNYKLRVKWLEWISNESNPNLKWINGSYVGDFPIGGVNTCPGPLAPLHVFLMHKSCLESQDPLEAM